MHAPQIIYIIILILGILSTINAEDGKLYSWKPSFISEVLSGLLYLSIFYWGGFFDNGFVIDEWNFEMYWPQYVLLCLASINPLHALIAHIKFESHVMYKYNKLYSVAFMGTIFYCLYHGGFFAN